MCLELPFYAIGIMLESMKPDTSHEMDMVTVFSSSNYDAEMEATAVHSLLRANGIPSVFVKPGPLPVLEFGVQVPSEHLDAARRVLSEAKAAGPEAAAEAEAAGEEQA